MARYLGGLNSRLARIEAERASMHAPFTLTTGRRTTLDLRDILHATGAALAWIHNGGAKPASRTLTTLAKVDLTSQTSLFITTAVRAAQAVVRAKKGT
ncbi:hypothetical protein [Streptomyces antibioticus]|uniref:hypothetical protein n=1 Tax=Streptomyces antibioticus TaxID=1890 RepID=UPI0033A68393